MVINCSGAIGSVTDHAAKLLCGEENPLEVIDTIKRTVSAHAYFSQRFLA